MSTEASAEPKTAGIFSSLFRLHTRAVGRERGADQFDARHSPQPSVDRERLRGPTAGTGEDARAFTHASWRRRSAPAVQGLGSGPASRSDAPTGGSALTRPFPIPHHHHQGEQPVGYDDQAEAKVTTPPSRAPKWHSPRHLAARAEPAAHREPLEADGGSAAELDADCFATSPPDTASTASSRSRGEIGPRSNVAVRVVSAPALSRGGVESSAGPVSLTFSTITAAGRHPTGHAKLCQDAFIARKHLLGRDVHLFGVIDAHGPHGAYIATALRRELPRRLVLRLRSTIASLPPSADPWAPCATAGDVRASLMVVSRAMQLLMTDMHTALLRTPAIDASVSGAAVHLLLLLGVHTFIINVGNCNSVLCQPRPGVPPTAWALSAPHLPSMDAERARIEALGGVVDTPPPHVLNRALPYDGQPWLLSPGDDPVVRMRISRSIGDERALPLGLLCDPVVTYGFLGLEGPSVLVLGSDGVWDVLAPADVAQMVDAALGAERYPLAPAGPCSDLASPAHVPATTPSASGSHSHPKSPPSPSSISVAAKATPAHDAGAHAPYPAASDNSSTTSSSSDREQERGRTASLSTGSPSAATRRSFDASAVVAEASARWHAQASASPFMRDRCCVVVVLSPMRVVCATPVSPTSASARSRHAER